MISKSLFGKLLAGIAIEIVIFAIGIGIGVFVQIPSRAAEIPTPEYKYILPIEAEYTVYHGNGWIEFELEGTRYLYNERTGALGHVPSN